ncbi:mitogen-activated protein kinase kinase kinase 13-like isoform X3 [Biomphalaria glabrata]|uniref:Mitogen-activated protein kinase kinase kinase 13-like isoform X3 n=1 Tax=Biomphalaria glabrata TaxID=6526 RepID=A0A9W2Z6J8_BIOGL|nr:mitogen-activated protein kinase kinase kinase 13-like isoform X3 [Biomphalaria glabrata]
MHLEIATAELLRFSREDFSESQEIWRKEIRENFQKMKAEGSNLPQLEEELIKRRKEGLRHAQDVREHYESKLERANNLYMELTACMLQLEKREQELIKREQLTLYNKHRKSIVRPIIKAQEKLDRLGKKRTHRSGSEVTTTLKIHGPKKKEMLVRMMNQVATLPVTSLSQLSVLKVCCLRRT